MTPYRLMPPCTDVLRTAGLSGMITIIASYGLDEDGAWTQGIALSSLAHASGRFATQQEAQEQIARGYGEMHADETCSYILRAWPSTRTSLEMQNFSKTDDSQGPWMLT